MHFPGLLTLLVGLVSASNTGTYVVMVPKEVRPGIPLSISVNILEATGDVFVTAKLLLRTKKSVISTSSSTLKPNVPDIIQLTVPDSLKSETYDVEVSGTNGLTFMNKTSLQYQSKSLSVFVQTDKAVYKPGDTVNFRAFAIYPDLTVYLGAMDIELLNPYGIKIEQWLSQKSWHGVLSNNAIVNAEANLGNWTIRIRAQDRTTDKVFTVAENVLPKFEVTVELPMFLLSSATEIYGTVQAKYTFGKSVKGTLKLRARLQNTESIEEVTMDLNGNTEFRIPMSTLGNPADNDKVTVEAIVTESVTEITSSESDTVTFHKHSEKIEFLPSNPDTFKPGLSYIAYIRVVQQDGTPIDSETKQMVIVHTFVTANLPYSGSTSPQGSLTTAFVLPSVYLTLDENGIVGALIDIPDNATYVEIQATYGNGVSSSTRMGRSYSPSDSYMQLFCLSSNLRVGHDEFAVFRVKSTYGIDQLAYQVTSRGTIVLSGSVYGNNETTFTFQVPLNHKMTPNARIIAYYVRKSYGEIVADSTNFDVDGTFENEVSVAFNTTEARPGDVINVNVTANPGSVVFLLAVDQSASLVTSRNDITPSEVLAELRSYDTISHPDWRLTSWLYPEYIAGSDAGSIFQKVGVNVMTDALVYHKTESYPDFPGIIPEDAPAIVFSDAHERNVASVTSPRGEVAKIHTAFPETWLWLNSSVRADGKVCISVTVPDTITSWVASAFAVHRTSGLGIAPATTKVRAFQQLFVSLTLPLSVVRHEVFVLQANVYNYMTQNMDVLVTLEKSDDFENVAVDSHGAEQFVSENAKETVRVLAGEITSVFFPIVPSNLGLATVTVKVQSTVGNHAVKRKLLIKPEGVPKEYNVSMLVDLQNSTTFFKNVDITLPENIVDGSSRVKVSVIGDILGPKDNGLERLLRIPYGDGEENMITFTPSVFVTNYLLDTNQLVLSMKAKAIKYIEAGYQRELSFKRTDGSFSAFGDNDNSGSMWLTAFVVKTFHHAKRLISIDDNELKRATRWMLNWQNASGSFAEPGRVIHRDMQGGSASGVSLTAFVLIALLENNDLEGEVDVEIKNAVALTQTYLENEVISMTDDYELAICSYALTLAKSRVAQIAFTKLLKDAVIEDRLKYWQYDGTTTYQSRDIEMTAYALMVYVQNGLFIEGLPVMKWIAKQMSYDGRYSSTQDTVLALQSLSEFLRRTYPDSFNMLISMTAGNTTKMFNVNEENALLLQSVELSSVPSNLVFEASGTGISLVEVSVFFNVKQEIEQPSFEVDVTINEESMSTLKVQTCSKWLKTGPSGVVVEEFGLLSGYEVDLISISNVQHLKKVKTGNRKVMLYFDEASMKPLCVNIHALRTGLVAKIQPVPVKMYAYNQQSYQVTKFYKPPLLMNSSLREICDDCGYDII